VDIGISPYLSHNVPLKIAVRFALLAAGAATSVSILAQSPTDFVTRALNNRDSVKASLKLLDAAKRSASGLGASPATRLEAGSGTRPDVNGGEDLTLFQPLDVFGKARGPRASGRAGIMIAESTVRQTKIDVQSEVLAALAAWSNVSRNLQTAQSQLELAMQLERATRARVQVRALPELQMTRVSLDVQRAEQVVVDRQAAVQSSLVKLKQVVGDSVGSIDPPSFQNIDLSSSDPDRDRPELLLLASQRNSFLADEKTAKLGQLPDFELQARRSPWATPEAYGIRFQFVIPLYDQGAARNKASAAHQQADATSLQYSDSKKKISAEIEAANINIVAAKKSFVAYTKLVNGVKELTDKTQRGFELGANTLMDVLDAKRALSDALEQQSNAQLSVDLAISELLRSQGQILGEKKR
jgi:cobalt-zinc-cadmium efflux system outer membrane protein